MALKGINTFGSFRRFQYSIGTDMDVIEIETDCPGFGGAMGAHPTVYQKARVRISAFSPGFFFGLSCFPSLRGDNPRSRFHRGAVRSEVVYVQMRTALGFTANRSETADYRRWTA